MTVEVVDVASLVIINSYLDDEEDLLFIEDSFQGDCLNDFSRVQEKYKKEIDKAIENITRDLIAILLNRSGLGANPQED